jgi:hypothetical protein
VKTCLSCRHTFDSAGWACPNCRFEPPKVEGFLSFAPSLAVENEGFPADGFDRLIRLGLRSPWGGSLLLVVKKPVSGPALRA